MISQVYRHRLKEISDLTPADEPTGQGEPVEAGVAVSQSQSDIPPERATVSQCHIPNTQSNTSSLTERTGPNGEVSD